MEYTLDNKLWTLRMYINLRNSYCITTEDSNIMVVIFTTVEKTGRKKVYK